MAPNPFRLTRIDVLVSLQDQEYCKVNRAAIKANQSLYGKEDHAVLKRFSKALKQHHSLGKARMIENKGKKTPSKKNAASSPSTVPTLASTSTTKTDIPELPEIFKAIIASLGGFDVTFVMQRKLTKTDLEPNNSRLAMPEKQINEECKFLAHKDAEILRILEARDGKGRLIGMQVGLIEPSGEVCHDQALNLSSIAVIDFESEAEIATEAGESEIGIQVSGDRREFGEFRKGLARVWGEKYFKNNFSRLAHVKTKVDPLNFFRGPHLRRVTLSSLPSPRQLSLSVSHSVTSSLSRSRTHKLVVAVSCPAFASSAAEANGTSQAASSPSVGGGGRCLLVSSQSRNQSTGFHTPPLRSQPPFHQPYQCLTGDSLPLSSHRRSPSSHCFPFSLSKSPALQQSSRRLRNLGERRRRAKGSAVAVA
ncbi:hypothetical protein HN51_041844 [Arachis hypogaea]